MSRRIACVTILLATMAVLAAVAVAAVVASGCGGASKTAKAASPSPSFTPPPAWVMKEAAAQAANGGDAHPVYAGWTFARLGDITPALGMSIFEIPNSNVDKQYYLVVLQGDFTTLNFTHPNGPAPPPVIHWVAFTLDPLIHEVSTMGWRQQAPPAKVARLLHPFQL